MSVVAGGARGGSHRIDPAKEEGLMLQKSLAEMESSRRRSLRKREEKSYVESPDLLFEDESTKKGRMATKANISVISNGDVEMESDDDDSDDEPLEPLPLPKEIPLEALMERKALIRQLQTQLRNEEMSLVLLKKIRQSQVLADQMAASGKSGGTSSVPNNSHSRGTPSPAPGKVGSPSVSLKPGQSSRHQPSPNTSKNLVPDLSQLKPVNVDPKSLPPGLPASLMNMINKSVGKSTNENSSKPQPKVDSETPQQKQAAAKLALRKQLEKTLLQIPPPKPPPPEMHFIPNPANTEFICLLGLEECVGKILHDEKENTIQPIPFTCSQCATDFTPTWKWDKGARGKEVKVICESCVTSNVKKALKAEHTNRLKAAFVKALQQEQELEAHMAQQAQATSQQNPSVRGTSPESTSRSGRAAAVAAASLPSSLDVTVRPAPSRSTHSQQPSSSSRISTTPSVTIERAHHHNQQQQQRTPNSSSSRSTAASITPRHSGSSLQRMSSMLGGGSNSGGSSTPPLNNSVSIKSSGSRSGGGGGKNDAMAMAAVARDSANAMAAAAALMGGYDPASMALLQAAAQQQMLLGAYGNSSSSGTNSNSTSRTGGSSGGGGSSSSGNNSNAAVAAALSSQLAAMSQQFMNPLLYNYQALAMAQAMQGLSGLSTTGGMSRTTNTTSNSNSSSGSKGSSSQQSATNQMLEIQRQVAAAEQLQRQYLLDMIPPGSLGQSWGKK